MIQSLMRIFVFLILIVTYGCSDKPTRFELSGSTMGTVWNVIIESDEVVDKDKVTADINELLVGINSVFSTWQPDSEVSKLNTSSEADTVVSEELGNLLAIALAWNRQTEGLFDITVKDLIDAYGFSDENVTRLPSDEEIKTLLAKTGSDKLTYTSATRQLHRDVAGIQLDFSAIAKGYAVKRVSDALNEASYNNHLVEIGGEVQTSGIKLNGQPWAIAVEEVTEDLTRTVQQPVTLSNVAIATSGDYRNYREIEGQRISHIINPKTGLPVQHKLASISVIHDDCTIADILATAIFVMGEDDGFEFANRIGVPIYMIVRDGEGFSTRHNDLMTPYLKEN